MNISDFYTHPAYIWTIIFIFVNRYRTAILLYGAAATAAAAALVDPRTVGPETVAYARTRVPPPSPPRTPDVVLLSTAASAA